MPKRSTKFYRKNEAEVMHRLGFKETKNSGAGWIEKEDGQSEHCICQLKSTDHRSISIKQDDLHILEHNAMISHKLPVFAFQFLNTDEVWVAVKETDIEAFRRLLGHVADGEEEKRKDTLSYLQDLFGDELEENQEKEKESIDKEKESIYNINSASKDKIKKSYQARQQYMKQKQKEKEQTEKELKERIRERRRKNIVKKRV